MTPEERAVRSKLIEAAGWFNLSLLILAGCWLLDAPSIARVLLFAAACSVSVLLDLIPVDDRDDA